MTEQSQRALDRNDDHVAEATERVAPIVAGVPVRLASLIARAEALAASGQRRILGITGAPGCGKGTVARGGAERPRGLRGRGAYGRISPRRQRIGPSRHS